MTKPAQVPSLEFRTNVFKQRTNYVIKKFENGLLRNENDELQKEVRLMRAKLNVLKQAPKHEHAMKRNDSIMFQGHTFDMGDDVFARESLAFGPAQMEEFLAGNYSQNN